MRRQQWRRNGTSSQSCQRGKWTRWRARKEVIPEVREKKKVHFATLMDIYPLMKCGVRSKAPKVQMTSRAPRKQHLLDMVHLRQK